MRGSGCFTFAFVVVSSFVASTQAQPLEWSDDFATAATYDSDSLMAPCSGGGSTKYTVAELVSADIYNERAVSGEGMLSVNNRSKVYPPGLTFRLEAVGIGAINFGQGCPDVLGIPSGESTQSFTSSDVCIYAGFIFNPWQLKSNQDLDGSDNLGGAPAFDDDHDGTTDEADEALALVAASGNNGYGPPFPGGPDGAPGVAGVDDDADGHVDDVGETTWPGSDDGDDNQGYIVWLASLRADLNASTAIYAHIQPGADSAPYAFALRELAGGMEPGSVELGNETAPGFYKAHTQYSYAFCVSGMCYGAQMWVTSDMANPAETLGPVMNSKHSGPVVGFLNVQGASGSNPWPGAYLRHTRWMANTNFSDKLWVVSGNPIQYYPSPSADLDADKDVDGFDFLTFSNCYNGSNKPPLAACGNSRADLDRDGDVDGFDFLTFSNCYNGSNRRPLAACFPPNLTACP